MTVKRAYTTPWVRSSKPKPFRLQEKDVELLGLLSEYRLLDLDQILVLLPRNKRSWERRLYFMFHAGMITRPPRQQDRLKSHAPMVYGLGNQGADLLARIDGTERPNTDWQRRNREIRSLQIEHVLMLSRARIALTLALSQVQGAKLQHWEPEGDSLNAKVLVNGEPLVIRPDAFFTIEVTGRPTPFHNFALEADRSTEAHAKFRPKLEAYWLGQSDYKDHLRISRFRVLTICMSPERRDNLAQLSVQIDARGTGSHMFLFSSESDYHLGQPETILGQIWRCGLKGCSTWHSLIE